jgi:hypothetical protein
VAQKRVAFIVRVWTETEGDELTAPVWRGAVQLVGSEQIRYFHSLDHIPAIIQTLIDQSWPGAGRRGEKNVK